MPFDPNFPLHGAGLVSQDWRNQFNALKALIDAAAPIGCVQAWLKSFPNTPALPAPWAECNGQVLSDAESPYNGATLPDLNGALGGAQRFLRGAAASGGTGGSDSLSIGSEVPVDNNGDASTTTVVAGPQTDLPIVPSYYEVVWVMRVR